MNIAIILFVLGVPQIDVDVNKTNCDVACYKQEIYDEIANEMKKNFTSMDLTPPRKNEFSNTTYHNRTVSKQIETYTNSLVDNGKPSANYDRSRNEEIETQASNDKHFRL